MSVIAVQGKAVQKKNEQPQPKEKAKKPTK